MWLAGLCRPHAFISSARLYVAARDETPVHDVQLCLRVSEYMDSSWVPSGEEVRVRNRPNAHDMAQNSKFMYMAFPWAPPGKEVRANAGCKVHEIGQESLLTWKEKQIHPWCLRKRRYVRTLN